MTSCRRIFFEGKCFEERFLGRNRYGEERFVGRFFREQIFQGFGSFRLDEKKPTRKETKHVKHTNKSKSHSSEKVGGSKRKKDRTTMCKAAVGRNKAQKRVMFGFLRIRICFKQLRNWIQDHNWLNKPLGANTVSTKLGTAERRKKTQGVKHASGNPNLMQVSVR